MNLFRTIIALSILSSFMFLPACKVGEDDPFISFRSRDARIKANWKLSEMENHYEIREINPGVPAQVTVIQSSFNGYDLHIRTALNGIIVNDTTFGFNHQLMIKDKGKLNYVNTFTQNLVGVKSTGEDNWYWLDTDKKKARIFVGAALQMPALAGLWELSQNNSLPKGTLFTDFTVDGLRNKELDLTYDKITEQITITGFQQIKVSSKMKFLSN